MVQGKRDFKKWLKAAVYTLVLACASAGVLFLFLRPTANHIGINQYEYALFLDMVHGKAYKPFVYRALVPGLVQLVSFLTPEGAQTYFRELVQGSMDLRLLFRFFMWETSAAFSYAVTGLMLWVSFCGFGHSCARWTLVVCGKKDVSPLVLVGLAVTSLLLLIPFFKYASYLYDPPQLCLFTMALYALARQRWRWFMGLFVLCCLNKETAILLIPLYFHARRPHLQGQPLRLHVLGLVGIYAGVKALLTYLFRKNPGTFVEWHLFDHNLPWFLETMGLGHIVVFLALMVLLFYRFREKDPFLRQAFLWTLPPLVLFTLFLGYIDEWRDYYEAYPAGFALIVHTLWHVRKNLSPKRAQQGR